MSSATKYVIAFAIIFILLALFALVLRRLTGNRATLVGERGRTRQPRLGIVDVYDLDRQRQLILLRRDNVEHLLLVGGPNDVVVETNIVRVAGARLPAAAAEAIDRLDDRTVEIAPMRPIVEPALARPNEGAVAAHLGNLETAVASAALEQVAPARPEPARSEPLQPAQRPAPPRAEPERPARPVVAAPAMPDVRAAPRPATAPMARGNPTPPQQAAAQPAPAPEPEKPVFTDMAQQLEDALRRGPPAGQEQARTAPPREDQQQRRGANGNGRPEPVPASPPPAPPRPAEARPAPRPQPPVQVVPPAPPAPAPAPVAAVQSPPAPAPRTEAGRDPFSIEDIEAEFARLLGRPLDKR